MEALIAAAIVALALTITAAIGFFCTCDSDNKSGAR
jgi:hypothetical protein